MSGECPAEAVARLETGFPLWSIRRCEQGRGLTAHRTRGDERLRMWAATPAEMTAKLSAIEHPRAQRLSARPEPDDGGLDRRVQPALRDAITYRASRPGADGQIGLYRIAVRRLLGIEL